MNSTELEIKSNLVSGTIGYSSSYGKIVERKFFYESEESYKKDFGDLLSNIQSGLYFVDMEDNECYKLNKASNENYLTADRDPHGNPIVKKFDTKNLVRESRSTILSTIRHLDKIVEIISLIEKHGFMLQSLHIKELYFLHSVNAINKPLDIYLSHTDDNL